MSKHKISKQICWSEPGAYPARFFFGGGERPRPWPSLATPLGRTRRSQYTVPRRQLTLKLRSSSLIYAVQEHFCRCQCAKLRCIISGLCYELTIKCNHKETITIFATTIFAIFLFWGEVNINLEPNRMFFCEQYCNVAIILLMCKIRNATIQKSNLFCS